MSAPRASSIGRRFSSVLLASAVALVACSGGSARLSAEEFADEANTTCEQTSEMIEEINVVDARDPDAAADGLDRITDLQRDLRDRLAELRPPSEAQALHEEWIAQIDVALDESERLTDAVRTGDVATQQDANTMGNVAVDQADENADELGATSCVASARTFADG